MKNQQTMVISVMERDRPGIVAETAEGICALGGNLADLSQTVLCGHFTMILVALFPVGTAPEQVEQELEKQTGARVLVEATDEVPAEEVMTDQAYVLSAVGQDRAGLVAQVSRFCFDRGVNILDLASHVEDHQYTMMLLIDLAVIDDIPAFEADLAELGKAAGLTIALQHNDIFKATNEIAT